MRSLRRARRMPRALIQDWTESVFGHAQRRRINAPGGCAAYEFYVDDEFVGTVERFPTGVLQSIHPWCDGQPHGIWQEFYKTGHVFSHVNYMHGKKTGLMLRWHDNETLAFASECHDDAAVVTTVTWDPEQRIKSWRRQESRDSTAFICAGCKHNTYWEGFGNAGFSDRGFLYNEAGDFVISWDAFDPSYVAIVGINAWPWNLDQHQRRALEDRLKPAPRGGRFLFSNPGRCEECRAPIASPLPESLYMWDTKKMILSGQGERFSDGPLANYLTH